MAQETRVGEPPWQGPGTKTEPYFLFYLGVAAVVVDALGQKRSPEGPRSLPLAPSHSQRTPAGRPAARVPGKNVRQVTMARERGPRAYSVPPLGQEKQLPRRFPTWPGSDGPGFQTRMGEPQGRGRGGAGVPSGSAAHR